MKILTSLLALGLAAATAPAATYYIDYAGGDDTADGRSAKSAWKHSPGDTNATGRPAALELAPGDTLLFKGGVTYMGSIRLTVSGEEDQHITLDGNLDGKFGKGPAVLDGGRVIEGWTRCASADQAGGNPLWKKIFFADIDLDISKNFNHGEVVVHREQPRDKRAPWQRVILYDGERRLLPIAQYPKPEDPFYPDLPRDFLESPHRLEVRKAEGVTVLTDPAFLKDKPANFYDGAFVGIHGGNNHTFFAKITGFDPEAHTLTFPEFKDTTYEKTQYAFYNSVRLISEPGEWAVEPLPGGKTRFYLLPDRLVKGKPANVGFPELESGVTLTEGASHITVKGFLIQRYAGVGGGVAVSRSEPRSSDIVVSDCEIRFVSGHAGIGPHYTDGFVVENCYIHHCPGWTTAIFLDRVSNYVVRNCLLDKNSGSGVRHYESSRGVIENNVILNHYGMHSSTINLYEGCEDIVVQGNYLHNVIAINRNAQNIIIRNNVIDSQRRNASNIAIWTSGRTRGTEVNNIIFEDNTLVNTDPDRDWSTSIFILTNNSTKLPDGLIVRNNVLDRLMTPMPALIQGNIYTRETSDDLMGADGMLVTDFSKLFRNPKAGDYRRRPGGPMMDAGADVPPPSKMEVGPRWKK